MALSVPGGSIGATGVDRNQGLAHLLDILERSRPSWHQRAACADPAVAVDFFDDKAAAIAAARDVCRGCPVSPQCGHFGATEKFGVWGGLAAVERGHGRRKAG